MISLMRFGIVGFPAKGDPRAEPEAAVLTVASGIANAMNLAVINAAVDALRGGGPSWQHFLWFGLVYRAVRLFPALYPL